MAKKDEQPVETQDEAAIEEASPRHLATWQWMSLCVAGAVTLLGLGLMFFGAGPEPANGQQVEAIGLMPGEAPSEEVVEEVDSVSPAVFRLGVSFVIGFAVAYALRTFVKISLVAFGVFALGLWGLHELGVITINTDAMTGHYDSARDYVSTQFGSLKSFLTGHLPSAGSALAGMAIGFKKA